MSFRVQYRKIETAEIIRSVERKRERKSAGPSSPDDTLQPQSNACIWKIARIRYGEYRISRTVRKLDVDFFRGEAGEKRNMGKEEVKKKEKQKEMQERGGVRYTFLLLPEAKIEFKASREAIDHHPPLRPRSLAFQFVLFVPG